MNAEHPELYTQADVVRDCDDRLTNREVGMRLLRVAILAIFYFIFELVAKTLTVLQFVFVAWQKRPHRGMQMLGTMMAEYMYRLWRYCTFVSDDAPWPFRPWQWARRDLAD